METDEDLGSDVLRVRRETCWRRALDVLDAYDTDRVCSERLADDLVNELLRGPRRSLTRR